MSYQNEQGQDVYTFDVPQREGKEGYIGMHFGLMLKMGSLMAEANRQATDNRIEYMAQFMISLIPGRKNRKIIRDGLQAEIKKRLEEEAKKSGTDLTNDQIGTIRNLTSVEYVGEVMDFLDKHVGVDKENRIGTV
jgi:hypothetical protein